MFILWIIYFLGPAAQNAEKPFIEIYRIEAFDLSTFRLQHERAGSLANQFSIFHYGLPKKFRKKDGRYKREKHGI